METLSNLTRSPNGQSVTVFANELSVSYRRCETLNNIRFKSLNSSSKIAALLRSFWDADNLDVRESFYLLCFSPSIDLIGFFKVADGGLDSVLVDVRLVFSTSLLCRAHAIVVAHNHPSGRMAPSEADRALTRKITQAGSLLSIKLLDHIILSSEQHYSFADEGDL